MPGIPPRLRVKLYSPTKTTSGRMKTTAWTTLQAENVPCRKFKKRESFRLISGNQNSDSDIRRYGLAEVVFVFADSQNVLRGWQVEDEDGTRYTIDDVTRTETLAGRRWDKRAICQKAE